MKLFDPVAQGTFIKRPNRFIVMAEINGKIEQCYCPNPGRLIELLIPGTPLLFELNPGPATKYTLSAAIRGNMTIPLYSSRANKVAAQLILPRLFPESSKVKAEFTHGNSRFDFMIDDGQIKKLIEIKACTLIEQGVASFPDAPTIRGLRHLSELAEADAREYKGMIIFVVFNPEAEHFVPNWHTDFDFARALYQHRNTIDIKVFRVSTDQKGECQLIPGELAIFWDKLKPHLIDGGVYLYILELDKETELNIGQLGKFCFQKGWYVYTGSARKNLDARIRRHLSKRKKFHWHIDYLGEKAKTKKILAIRNQFSWECELAASVNELSLHFVPGFGSSDCHCQSHLFYFNENPFHNRDFLDMLFFIVIKNPFYKLTKTIQHPPR
ncbi:MAG: DNA/RNA nuclease SfsA [Spirochaetales bacterium]|nr:DNA/RNA nuclease SfsA [Spirochaetales bacterium]